MTVVPLFAEHAEDCPFCGTMLARHKSGFAHPGDHRDESCPMNGRAIRNLAAWNRRDGFRTEPRPDDTAIAGVSGPLTRDVVASVTIEAAEESAWLEDELAPLTEWRLAWSAFKEGWVG